MAERDVISAWYGIMPNKVLYDKKLNDKQKLLYCCISSLCAKEWFCWASNEYLGEMFGVDKKTISRNLNALKDAWYLDIEVWDNYKRKISMSTLDKNVEGDGQKCPGGDGQKCGYINTSVIITNNNLANAKENQPQPQEYWNKDVNNLIRELRGACEELGVAYDSDSDRNFAYNLLRKKDYEELCKKEWQNKVEFAINILKASVWLWYYVVCSWPKLIYRNYADVYNKVLQKKNKNNIPKFDVLY